MFNIIISVLEKWSPYEISIFEATLTLYGKNFFRVQKHVSFYFMNHSSLLSNIFYMKIDIFMNNSYFN
jgi:hypothetical protein